MLTRLGGSGSEEMPRVGRARIGVGGGRRDGDYVLAPTFQFDQLRIGKLKCLFERVS